ncbi:MAG: Ohr family peroxiredoxin [Alphaproteobacteria bacterium]
MSFSLPDLPYAPDALGPYMSAETMGLHHGKHHQAYVTKLNELTASGPFSGKPLEEVVKSSYGVEGAEGVFNNAGQHWNHCLFWTIMKPNGGGAIPGQLGGRLADTFGSIDEFKAKFAAEGVAQFGSGWVWLVEANGKLEIMKTPNAVNPLVFGKKALLPCDVWEHSYYVDYRNRRADYIKAFLDHLVNWENVARRLEEDVKVARLSLTKGNSIMTVLYVAQATAVGGREGHAETSDKKIAVDLSTPGGNKSGTNPEQLFACGYAACFGSAVQFVAGQKKIDAGVITVASEVSLHKDDKGFSISAVLNVLLPALDPAAAADLVRAAHEVCPYSKATRGNIEVTLKANGAAV